MITKRLISLLLAAALLLGCAAALADAEDPVLFTVNGTEIRQSQATVIYDYYISMYASYGYDMEDPENQAVIRAFTTQELVWETLINAYAAEHGLDVFTDEETAEMIAENEAQWDEAIADYIAYETGLTDLSAIPEEEMATLRANAIAYYESQGFTVESTLNSIRQVYVNERVKASVLEGEDISVTEEDIAALHAQYAEEDRIMLYDEEGNYGMSPTEVYSMYSAFGYEMYYIPAGFRTVKHILLVPDQAALENYLTLAARWEEQAEGTETGEGTDGEPVTYEQVEEARLAVIASVQPQLDAIADALQQGTSFDELIALYGTDAGMTEGPAAGTGYMVCADSYEYDAAFLQGAFSVENPGEISDPVVTSFGVHVILYAADVPEGPVPMTQEMHDTYYENLTADAENNAFDTVVQHWMDEADIVYTEAGEPWRMDILLETDTGDSATATDAADEAE